MHSNGFSLVRKLVSDYAEPFNGKPIGETLLEPTRIYVKPVLALLEKMDVHGMVHITGGGFYENIPRMLTTNEAIFSSSSTTSMRTSAFMMAGKKWPASKTKTLSHVDFPSYNFV